MQNAYKIGYWVLFCLLFLVAGLLTFSLFPIKGNYEIKIVQSGSMEPTIRTGSIVIVKPESGYNVGDIITFGKDTKASTPTTHRIVAVHATEGVLYFKTKGDANETEDVEETAQSSVIGKVVLSVPYLGYLIDFAKKPIGFGLIVGIPAAIIIWDEIEKIIREMKRIKARKEKDTAQN